MGFLTSSKRKLQEIANSELNDEEQVNLSKEASDKAVSIIKELSGKSNGKGKKLIDNIVVITNASGGAGASTLTHNIAYEALRKKLKVIIVDLNILCPIQHAYLGIEQKLDKNDLVSFLLGKSELSDSIDTTSQINLLFANNKNINDCINANEKIAVENFRMMIDKLRQFYDLVLIDCPMRVDSMLENTALYMADAIYIVWDEGLASSINTEKLRRNMALSGIDSFTKMRVILNKRTSIHFSDYPIKKMNLELIGVLPFDVDIIDNSLRGKIFCENGSSSSKNAAEFAVEMGNITDKILKIGGYVE